MSHLDDLYKEVILDHYRSPRNRGELPAPAVKVEGHNPLCGDEITLFLAVEGDVVTDIKMTGHGCSISQASSSLMSAAIKGKSVIDVRQIIDQFKNMMSLEEGAEPVNPRAMGELAALSGVAQFPVRIKCATLAWNTLLQALDESA